MMRIAMFYHSLVADWNHGSAHFLRGIASELLADGHDVAIHEPQGAWSVTSLLETEGPAAIEGFHEAYPRLGSRTYALDSLDLNRVLDNVDLVLVHECNDPELVARIGGHRAHQGGYVLLYHDTRHRPVGAAEEAHPADLTRFDGVLVPGESLRRAYLDHGWAANVFVWHPAADTRLFRPRPAELDGELVWIGNWGDRDRSAELHEFLIQPVRELGLRATVYGVRYPAEGLAALADAGIRYGGYLPNYRVPEILARYRLTVHIPHPPCVQALPGIASMRMFEAMACARPLICAPWDDIDGLFNAGFDYLPARDGEGMTAAIDWLLSAPRHAAEYGQRALATIGRRHTCGHRVDSLLTIARGLGGDPGHAGLENVATCGD